MEISGLSRARWRRSSYSGTNGNCIEAAAAPAAVAVRDSKDPDGPRSGLRPRRMAGVRGGRQGRRTGREPLSA